MADREHRQANNRGKGNLKGDTRSQPRVENRPPKRDHQVDGV